MAEETVTLNFSDNASAPAGIAAEALDRVDKALDKLDGKEADVKTGKLSEASMAFGRLRDLAGRAGSAMALSLNGVTPAAAGASAAGVKLSSVFDVLKRRADAFKAAEKEAFDVAVKAANKLPDHLKVKPTGEVSGFAKMTGLIGNVFGQKGTDAFLGISKELAKVGEALGPAGPVLLQGGKLLALGAAALGVAAVALVAAAAVVVYKLLEAGLKLAVAQTSIREGFESSIAKMVGGAQAAKDIFNTAIKIAVDLGLDKEAVLAKAKELVGVGFRGAEVDVILRTRADIAAGGSEEKANAFQKALEKLKSGKQFGQETLNGLAEAGINADAVLQKLSTQLGITVDKVKEKLKAGQIDVKTGMAAIIAAAQGQYGGAGAGAANTIPAQLQGLKTLFESMFDSVDLSGIKSALDSVKKIFEGPDGEKFKAAVNTLFGKISDIFGKAFSGKDGEARLERFITGITKLMEGAAVVVEASGPQIIAILDGISKVVDRNGSSSGGSWLQSIASGLLAISGAMIGVDFNAFGSLIGSVMDSAVQAMNGAIGTALSIGSDIVQGLINGILNMGPNVASALGSVVQSAIDAANKLLGRHSPAKATIDMGRDTGLGYVIGLTRTMPLVANAGQSMAASALGGASNDNAVPAVTGTAGAGAGGATTIIVQVQSGPGQSREHAQAQGDAAGEAAHRAWVRSHTRWMREQGRAA